MKRQGYQLKKGGLSCIKPTVKEFTVRFFMNKTG